MGGLLVINAGSLDTPVRIERPRSAVSAENDYGEIDTTVAAGWELVGIRSAQVLTQGSREVFRSRQFQPDTTHVLRLRYDTLTQALNPEMRLVVGTRSLEIIGCHDMNERHEVIEATCREKKN